MECFYEKCAIRKEGCEGACPRLSQMLFLFESAQLPLAKRKPIRLVPDECDVAAFERLDEIRNNARKFVYNGMNLFICGNVTGNGKTSWAIKIMQNYFNQVWAGNNYRPRGLFVSVPQLLSLQSMGFSDKGAMARLDELLQKACQVDLVIWDDVACTEMTKPQQNMLQGVLDQRLNSGLANVFTGNMQGMPLRAAVGQRIFSRIETNSEVVFLMGRDMRNGAIADNK